MRVFLDVGNTRLKWVLEDAQTVNSAQAVAASGSIDYKKNAWQNEDHIDASATIDSAWASSVASVEVRASIEQWINCLLYTSPSPRDQRGSRMPSSA